MARLKRISMAGADIAVTDGRLADLMLEFAMHLGRVGTTDTVEVPVARNGRLEHARLLLGPASQIAVTESDDPDAERIALAGVDEVLADIRRRLDGLVHRETRAIQLEQEPPVNYDDFEAFSE